MDKQKTSTMPEPEPVDPQADWVTVEALENLFGGGTEVSKGDRYKQPPAAARDMARRGWVKIVPE